MPHEEAVDDHHDGDHQENVNKPSGNAEKQATEPKKDKKSSD